MGGRTQPPPEPWLAVGRVVKEETLIFSVLLSSAEASLKPEGKELRGWCSEISVWGCRGRYRMALVGVGVEK